MFSRRPAGSIVGRIRIAPGNEINSPILVTLSSRGETVNSVYTDNEGHFGFSGLPGNLYHVVVNEEGYLPVEEDVSVDPVTTSMKIVTIYLVPSEAKTEIIARRSKAATPVSPTPSSTAADPQARAQGVRERRAV